MTDFGAGPKLTQDLDFEITNTGDIETVSGVRELEKDLSLQSIIELENVGGMRSTPQNKARIRSRVRNILSRDPRVLAVPTVNVTFVPARDSVEIISRVLTDNGDQELVFNL